MKDNIQKSKTFPLTISNVLLTIIFAILSVLSCALIIVFYQPTENERLVIYICCGVMLLFIFTLFLFLGTGTVRFYEDRIIVKEWLFSRRRYLLYSEIDQINFFYGYVPTGLRSASGQCISIFRKKRKNAVINIEITYPIAVEVLKHTEGISIKVGFSSLLKFSKKHRELLWDYLKESQKQEILSRVDKKKKK